MSQPENAFSFDRRVTLAIVLAIVIEATSVLLWTGAAAERIEQLEIDVGRAELVTERLARLEAQTTAMRAQLDRIEARLDQR